MFDTRTISLALALALALAASTLLPPRPAAAAWSTDPASNVPVCQAPGSQTSPQIATDGAHGAIVVWQDTRPGTLGQMDLYAQRVDSSGTVRWTADGVVVCSAEGFQGGEGQIKVVPDGAGGVIVVWADSRNSPVSGVDIYAQRLDGNGVPQWAPANGIIVCDAPFEQGYGGPSTSDQLSAAADGSGGAVIAWHDSRRQYDPYPENKVQVYAQRISGAGTRLWAPGGVEVGDSFVSNWLGGIVSDGTGGALVYHHVGDVTGNTDSLTIAVSRLGPSGEKIGAAALCSSPPAEYCNFFPQAFASDGNGGLLALWRDALGSPSPLLAGRVDRTGAILWSGVPVCPSCEVDWMDWSRIVPDGAGGGIAILADIRASRMDIYAQRVDGIGNTRWGGAGVLVNTLQQDQPFVQQATEDGAGGAIVVWPDLGTGSGYASYAQRLSADGAALWAAGGEVFCDFPSSALAPVVIHDGLQRGIVAFNVNRLGDQDVYVQRVPFFGTPLSVSRPAAARTVLGRPAPNPVSARARIPLEFAPEFAGRAARVTSFDVLGRRVRVWDVTAGSAATLEWDGRDQAGRRLPAGVYTIMFTLDGEQVGTARRLVWMKGD